MELFAGLAHQVVGQDGQVFEPFPKRRHRDLHHSQPVVEVFPEVATGHPALQIPMRGRDDPGLGAFRLFATHRIVLVVLQDPQELALELGGGVADLIQEDGAPSGQGDAAPVVGSPRP